MADVLFVVDCSGSMTEERERLVEAFADFIENLTEDDGDFHIGVTSCDVENPAHSGHLLGTPAVLATDGPDALTDEQLIQAFNDRIDDLGATCEGEQEAPLDAAYRALSEPLLSGSNTGFLRDDAKLMIVFVSDEDDQSMATSDFYIDFFRSIKGMHNLHMLEVYALAGDLPNGCEGGSGGTSASAASRLIGVADACKPAKRGSLLFDL